MCQLHFDLVTEKDPSRCIFSASSENDSSELIVVIVSIFVPFVVMLILVQLYCNHKRNQAAKSDSNSTDLDSS